MSTKPNTMGTMDIMDIMIKSVDIEQIEKLYPDARIKNAGDMSLYHYRCDIRRLLAVAILDTEAELFGFKAPARTTKITIFTNADGQTIHSMEKSWFKRTGDMSTLDSLQLIVEYELDSTTEVSAFEVSGILEYYDEQLKRYRKQQIRDKVHGGAICLREIRGK